ncbi:hypothetical protein [Lactococcus petauri]|uniref:hypothetical protein n=1 Tax=Lactococcus petauri TaxID=1940789 RepID=UPI0022E401DB|nr:hypothetical protein [Lactococcus petauri]
MKKRWTEDEDDYLKYFVFSGDSTLKDAAELLGKTPGAVSARLTELRKIDRSVQYLNRRWTEKEDDYLRENYLKYDTKILSKNLGRTVESVKSRKSHLKLSLVRPITKHKKIIIALANKGYYRKEIARFLNIDEKSLANFLRLNKIHCDYVPLNERTKDLKKVITNDSKNRKQKNQ